MTERVMTDANGRKYITTEPFKPDWNTEAVLVEEMQRMAKRIEELEALAQPEQPSQRDLTGPERNVLHKALRRTGKLIETSQTAPQRTWVGLTDEEIEAIGEMVANAPLVGIVPNFRVRLARAIEAALKAKNT